MNCLHNCAFPVITRMLRSKLHIKLQELFATCLGDNMGRVFSTYRGDNTCIQNLVKKSDGRVPVRGAVCVWENDIEMEL